MKSSRQVLTAVCNWRSKALNQSFKPPVSCTILRGSRTQSIQIFWNWKLETATLKQLVGTVGEAWSIWKPSNSMVPKRALLLTGNLVILWQGDSLQESEARSEQSFNRRGRGMNTSQAKKSPESTQSQCPNHQASLPTSSAETARSLTAWRSEEFSKNLTS